MLRGFAVFGIFVVNLPFVLLPTPIAESPVALIPGERGAAAVWFLVHTFFDTKFITLFSLLFGAGFALQWMRHGQGAFETFYKRRLWILLGIGLLHGLVLFAGEVLALYALTGFVLYRLRRRTIERMLAIAKVMLPVSLLLMVAIQVVMFDQDMSYPGLHELVDDLRNIREEGLVTLGGVTHPVPLSSSVALEFVFDMDRDGTRATYALHAFGPGWPLWLRRAGFYLLAVAIGTPLLMLWRTLALFLVAAAAVRSGWLDSGRERWWRRGLAVGWGLGLPVTLLATWFRDRAMAESRWFIPGAASAHEVSAWLLAVGTICLVLLWCSTNHGRRLRVGLAAAGRMALSNYIAQSVIMFIFSAPFALGLYGRLTRVEIFLTTIAVFGMQVAVSVIWLRRFRMGPLEYLWRRGTYRGPRTERVDPTGS